MIFNYTGVNKNFINLIIMNQSDSQTSSPSQFLHFEIPRWECWTLRWPCWSRWHPTDHLLSASASHCSTKHRLIWLQIDLKKTEWVKLRHTSGVVITFILPFPAGRRQRSWNHSIIRNQYLQRWLPYKDVRQQNGKRVLTNLIEKCNLNMFFRTHLAD